MKRSLTTMAIAGITILLFQVTSSTAQDAADSAKPDQKKPAVTKATDKDNEKEQVGSANFWMTQKMRLSTKMLEGLATGDFDKIASSGELMTGLNRVESFWRRGESTEEYRHQLQQFNQANRRLVRYARKENLEGVTLAFNQLTISCVSCHQHLREATVAVDKP